MPHREHVFRPRLPLDPFSPELDLEQDVGVSPWRVPSALPESHQVILILGQPNQEELDVLLTSPQHVHSLLIHATHTPHVLRYTPLAPTAPVNVTGSASILTHAAPCVRVLHLPTPLDVHDGGALRLVNLLERAQSVAALWREQSQSHRNRSLRPRSLLLGPSSAPAPPPRFLQLAQRPDQVWSGEFCVVERDRDITFSSSNDTNSSNKITKKRNRLSKLSTHNSSSLSFSSMSFSSHPAPSASNLTLNQGQGKGKQKEKGFRKGEEAHTYRIFDAIINFLPSHSSSSNHEHGPNHLPDKALLKHAILVTTLGAPYLNLPSDPSLGLGVVPTTTTIGTTPANAKTAISPQVPPPSYISTPMTRADTKTRMGTDQDASPPSSPTQGHRYHYQRRRSSLSIGEAQPPESVLNFLADVAMRDSSSTSASMSISPPPMARSKPSTSPSAMKTTRRQHNDTRRFSSPPCPSSFPFSFPEKKVEDGHGKEETVVKNEVNRNGFKENGYPRSDTTSSSASSSSSEGSGSGSFGFGSNSTSTATSISTSISTMSTSQKAVKRSQSVSGMKKRFSGIFSFSTTTTTNNSTHSDFNLNSTATAMATSMSMSIDPHTSSRSDNHFSSSNSSAPSSSSSCSPVVNVNKNKNARLVHVLPASWVPFDSFSSPSSSASLSSSVSASVYSHSHTHLHPNMYHYQQQRPRQNPTQKVVRSEKLKVAEKPKLVQSIEGFLVTFSCPNLNPDLDSSKLGGGVVGGRGGGGGRETKRRPSSSSWSSHSTSMSMSMAMPTPLSMSTEMSDLERKTSRVSNVQQGQVQAKVKVEYYLVGPGLFGRRVGCPGGVENGKKRGYRLGRAVGEYVLSGVLDSDLGSGVGVGDASGGGGGGSAFEKKATAMMMRSGGGRRTRRKVWVGDGDVVLLDEEDGDQDQDEEQDGQGQWEEKDDHLNPDVEQRQNQTRDLMSMDQAQFAQSQLQTQSLAYPLLVESHRHEEEPGLGMRTPTQDLHEPWASSSVDHSHAIGRQMLEPVRRSMSVGYSGAKVQEQEKEKEQGFRFGFGMRKLALGFGRLGGGGQKRNLEKEVSGMEKDKVQRTVVVRAVN